MFFKKRNKEENRYYLLPGMGKSNRRQHDRYLVAAIIVGVIVSAIAAVTVWYFSRNRF